MKKIIYLSSDKLYKIKNRKFSGRTLAIFCITVTALLVVASMICFKASVSFNAQEGLAKYSADGKVDYKIYLKDNDYYDTTYLDQGMQYVAGLIKTVNVRYDYQVHAEQALDFNATYKVVGELQITEKDSPNKILYTKKDILFPETNINIKDKYFTINEELDIDYDMYNSLVNAYKRDYGLVVSSNLLLTLEVDTKGTIDGVDTSLNKSHKLQMSIPLSEQTVNIKMLADNVHDTGVLLDSNKLFVVTNPVLFVLFVLLFLLTVAAIALDIYIYLRYYKKDIYRSTLSKILKDYDRIIVNGKLSINEKDYKVKICPETFEEMVDAAQQLELPIYYYETIPNEKSYFVIVNGETLYKYRLTRAFLEKNPNNRDNNELTNADEKIIEKEKKKVIKK